MKRFPNIFILVLNWNGYKDTIECVESLQRLAYPNYEIVLIDNGSTDGSQNILKDRFKELTLIENEENLGFADGNNVGIKHALRHNADYIFLLNNDATIAPDALSYLVDFAEENTEIGLVGPKILFYNDPDKIWFAGGIVDLMTGVTHRGYGQRDDGKFDELAEVDYITGCALLIKSEVIRKIGLMSSEYYLLFEESDWCLRAKEAGYQLYYVPQARVLHKCSASFGGSRSLGIERAPSWIYYYSRNNFLLIKRHLHGHSHFKAYLYCLKRNLKWVDWRNSEQRLDRLLAIITGIVDFFLGKLGKRENLNFRKFWIR